MDSLTMPARLNDGRRQMLCGLCAHEWIRPAPDGGSALTESVLPPDHDRVHVTFGPTEAARMWAVAERRYQQMLESGHPIDDRTSPELCYMGLLGETAVLERLSALGVRTRSIADDPEAILQRLGDLELIQSSTQRHMIRIEVKTASSRSYREDPSGVLHRHRGEVFSSEADVYVACEVSGKMLKHPGAAVGVSLVCWLPVPEFADYEGLAVLQGALEKLPLPRMRPIPDLTDWLRERATELQRGLAPWSQPPS